MPYMLIVKRRCRSSAILQQKEKNLLIGTNENLLVSACLIYFITTLSYSIRLIYSKRCD